LVRRVSPEQRRQTPTSSRPYPHDRPVNIGAHDGRLRCMRALCTPPRRRECRPRRAAMPSSVPARHRCTRLIKKKIACGSRCRRVRVLLEAEHSSPRSGRTNASFRRRCRSCDCRSGWQQVARQSTPIRAMVYWRPRTRAMKLQNNSSCFGIPRGGRPKAAHGCSSAAFRTGRKVMRCSGHGPCSSSD